MSRVPWKEDKVISIETGSGIFVLAQMLRSPYLAIFDTFRTTNQWDDTYLDALRVLFCKAVTRQFISCSNVQRQSIEPCHANRVSAVLDRGESRDGSRSDLGGHAGGTFRVGVW